MALTEEQAEVVHSWGRGLAVLAGAGCGKTTTLVAKCQALIERDPEARFAAVSFTEKSAEELKARFTSLGILSLKPESRGRHWVTTIHGLCSSIAREYAVDAGLDGEETVLTESESQALWSQAVESLWFREPSQAVLDALNTLLERENRKGLLSLLQRVRSLAGFGILSKLEGNRDLQALGIVSQYVLDRYQAMKRRRGSLDFDDLEKAAQKALRSQTVCTAYHERFDLILVDEFQDTNPVQAEILLQFSRPDRSNLCVVGDPKQSIYRFRDADLTVFEDICKKLPERRSLTWNFRSRPEILRTVNELCEPLFQASELQYEPLVPKREASLLEKPVLKLNLTSEKDLAQWIRAQIDQGERLSEMALVLRKIRGNEALLRALQHARIPIAVASGSQFWEDPRVREMVSGLSWWENPSNTLSAVTFLRAPWIGVPDATIDEWIQEKKDLKKAFSDYDHPVSGNLQGKVLGVASPSQILEAFLATDWIEQELGPAFFGLWHRCEELSSMGMDAHRVVRELKASIDEGRKARDVPPPDQEGQLKVLTIHSSKGLEFPCVILADFSKPWRGGGMPLLYWNRETGAYLGKRDEEGTRLGDDDEEERLLRSREKIEELRESKRLFYVALTRARERLVLACMGEFALSPSQSGKSSAKDPLKTDDWRHWVEKLLPHVAVDHFHTEVIESKTVDEVPGFEQAVSKKRERTGASPVEFQRPRHSATEWMSFDQCERAYEWKILRPSSLRKPETVQSDASNGGLSGRDLGTAVHSILERSHLMSEDELRSALRDLEKTAQSQRFKADELSTWALHSPWMRSADPEVGRRVWSELQFEVPIPYRGRVEVMVGAMDRLIVEGFDSERPDFQLIDFKITRGRTREDLLKSYTAQLRLYSWVIGYLDPRSRDQVKASLVHIHPAGVDEISVPLQSWQDEEASVLRRLDKISHLISGEKGFPRPGTHCSRCEFLDHCPEAQRVI